MSSPWSNGAGDLPAAPRRAVLARRLPALDGRSSRARWLEQKGIDLLFVPVRKMTEVYPESFTEHCPPDRIIAPQVRRIMLELLEEDVEVVDLLGPLLNECDSDAEPLYLPADPHWGPRAYGIAARLIADRLARHDFVARAKASPPTCEWAAGPYKAADEGAAFPAMNPDQRRRAIAVQPRSSLVPEELHRASLRPGRGGGLHRR